MIRIQYKVLGSRQGHLEVEGWFTLHNSHALAWGIIQEKNNDLFAVQKSAQEVLV